MVMKNGKVLEKQYHLLTLDSSSIEGEERLIRGWGEGDKEEEEEEKEEEWSM